MESDSIIWGKSLHFLPYHSQNENHQEQDQQAARHSSPAELLHTASLETTTTAECKLVYVCGRGLNSKGNRGCSKRGEGEDDFLPSRSCINGWDLDPDWTLTLTLTLTLKLVLQQLGLEVLWRWTFTLVIWRVCYHVKCFLHLLGYGIGSNVFAY